MKKLDDCQMECLRKIASGTNSGTVPCTSQTLACLLEAGLIERAPYIWLPARLIGISYRVTSAGAAVLRSG